MKLFYNPFEQIWFKYVFNPKIHETFEDVGLTKIIHFYVENMNT
jgi:hypothetical protein